MRWEGFLIILLFLVSCGRDDENPGPLSTGLDVTNLNPGATLSGNMEMLTYDPAAGTTLTLTFGEATMEFDIPVDRLDTSQSTSLSVEPINSLSNLPEAVSSVVALRFEPDGFSFFEPVRVTVDPDEEYDFSQLAAFRISDGDFRFIPMVQNEDGTLTFLIDHFSDYGLLNGVDEIKAIANPTTADDYLNNLAAAQKKAEHLIDEIFDEFYNNILRPRLEIEKGLDELIEDIKAELRFIGNKQMLGIESGEEDYAGVRKMFLYGMNKLDSTCQATDCRWNYPPVVVKWIAYSQQLGLEDDGYNFETFCGGKLLEIIRNLEFEQPGPIEVVLGQTTEIGIDLFTNNLHTGAYEQLSRGYDQVLVSTTNPEVLTAEIRQAENNGGPTEIVSHITVTGLSLGSATVVIADPCEYMERRLIVNVVESQPLTGTATFMCSESSENEFYTVTNIEKQWNLTVVAQIAFNAPSGTYIVDESSITGDVTMNRETCSQGNCFDEIFAVEINTSGQTGTGNAAYLAKFNVGNVFGIPTTIYLEGDIIDENIENGMIYTLLDTGCSAAAITFQ